MAGNSRNVRLAQVLVGLLILSVSLGVGFAILSFSTDGLDQALVNAVVSQIDSPVSDDDTEVVFVVQEGETATGIANRLEKEGLIRNALVFRLLARNRGLDAGIEAGEHRLRRNMRTSEVLAALQSASARQDRMTVLEGWRAIEIADEAEFRGIATREEFLALAGSGNWPYDFLRDRPPASSLEGYLFPDTYELTPGITARDLIGKMLDNFNLRVLPEWDKRPRDLELTLHEAITLASIVEREAQVPEERPLIAGVYLNRLRRGMLLQADPTVQYALVDVPAPTFGGYWKKELSAADLSVDSPYNTYRTPGLPPGPICNPGLASIQAALRPAATEYLYFVAKGDGSHVFAETLAEHDENVRLYR